MFRKEDIITGEKIQMLCDVYIGTEYDFNFNPSIKKQVSKHVYIKKIKNKLKKKGYDNPKNIFIYPSKHTLKEKYLRNFRNPYNLFLHNSDANITNKYSFLLNIPNIIKIYSQNCTIIDPKVIQLPIGIANSQWEHGNLDRLIKTINMNNKKVNNFFLNFSVKTNKLLRNNCKKIISNKGISFIKNKPLDEYLQLLSTYKYCICPEGNGLDTHRFWECLYLGVIPITLRNKIVEKFQKKFPIVILNKWEDFNKEELLNNYEKILNSKQNYKELLKISNLLNIK